MTVTNDFANDRNKRLLYMERHPELFSIQEIKDENPKLFNLVMGLQRNPHKFERDTSLVERLLLNMDHQTYLDNIQDQEDPMEDEEDPIEEIVNSNGLNAESTPETADQDSSNQLDSAQDQLLDNEERETELIKMAKELFLAGKMLGFDYRLVETERIYDHIRDRDLEDAYFDS